MGVRFGGVGLFSKLMRVLYSLTAFKYFLFQVTKKDRNIFTKSY